MDERVRLPSALVHGALAYAAARGKPMSARVGGEGAEPPVVTAQEARELLEEIAERLGDPLLGIHLAQALETGRYGVVEFACRSAPDVRGALQRIVRFIALVSAPAIAELTSSISGMSMRFRFPGVRESLGRHGNEFFAAVMLRRAREYTGQQIFPTHVRFEHAAPTVKREIETFFNAPAEFGAEWNEIGFDEDSLALPILSHEPALLSLLDKMAEEQVKTRPTSFSDEVAQHVRLALEKGEPALEDVAKALGMSGRTMQRRPNEESRPFADVVDSVRRELALIYIADPTKSPDDVATLLGYAGARPFQRAFKRWMGVTPVEYRNQRKQGI